MNRNIQPQDCLRVVMLYALRYHRDPRQELASVLRMLHERGVDPDVE